MMNSIKIILLIAMTVSTLNASAAPAPSPWESPTAELANQIAEILGPGQAQLTIRNLSTISSDEIPAIRRLIEQDLKSHGVTASGAESANVIRITLSEDRRERLWVAEIVEGNETRVAMVRVEQGAARPTQAEGGVMLRKQAVLVAKDAVLAALEIADALVVVEPEEIAIYSHSPNGWQERQRVEIGQKTQLPRDPRAVILSSPGGNGFEAWLAGMNCSGSYQPAQQLDEWSVRCRESNDFWPIALENGASTLKAFYNASRNYFTGVVTPAFGIDLPPFYTAALLPRASNGRALLIGGMDGKVLLLENGALKPVSGARDWGSDFAALQSGCGAGTQIIASGSGEAVSDSLRAYELPALEAVPVSAALVMDGSVTAIWSAPDGKSVFAVVRNATNQYEVDRVTASCN